MVTVWFLIAYLGGPVPTVIENIASEAACRELATQMYISPYLTNKDKPTCFAVSKVLGR